MHKGVSLMISAVLLVGLALTLGLITSDFVSKLSKERTQQITNITKEKLNCQYANLYIRNVSFDCNNNCSSGISHRLNVTVVNSGTKTVKIDSLYLRNTTGALFTFTTGTIELNASDVLTISNTSSSSCHEINRTIDRAVVSSLNCPDTAFDSMPGSDVAFLRCG